MSKIEVEDDDNDDDDDDENDEDDGDDDSMFAKRFGFCSNSANKSGT